MITAFIPCRAGSQRVPKKNTKVFAGVPGGLVEIKLRQILNVSLIDKIILSTNDPEVISIGKSIDKRIIIDERPEHLATSETSTDDLINYVSNVITEGHVLWTHVTSPFLSPQVYELAIEKYLEAISLGQHDSLMTVNKIQTFLWDEKGGINYDRKKEKWPRTQTLKKIFEINSGIFLNSVENYIKFKDRIGKSPVLYKTEGYASFDIDWPEDFKLAELIYTSTKN